MNQKILNMFKKEGIFIFNIANANGYGYDVDITVNYCRYNTTKTITKLIQDEGFKIEFILPSYYTIPLIGAHPSVTHCLHPLFFHLWMLF